MKSTRVLLSLSFLIASLVGCATPVHSAFKELKVGDDKATALELLGSPKHSLRRDGKDFWVYRYYRDGSEYKRTITFASSRIFDISSEQLVIDPREFQLEKELEAMTPSTPVPTPPPAPNEP